MGKGKVFIPNFFLVTNELLKQDSNSHSIVGTRKGKKRNKNK